MEKNYAKWRNACIEDSFPERMRLWRKLIRWNVKASEMSKLLLSFIKFVISAAITVMAVVRGSIKIGLNNGEYKPD